MKVLITGGAGYVGSHTNRLFRERGIDTVVLDDLSSGHREAAATGKFFRGSVGDRALLDRVMTEHRFTAVIHFAALVSVPESVENPGRYFKNNVTNMQVLLDACVAHGIRYFVFSSSAAVFGEPQYSPVDERHPLQPINPYGVTKLLGERLLEEYERAYGIHFCALRYFCAAGSDPSGLIGEAHEPETHLIPLTVRAMRTGKPLTVFGGDYATRDGSCVRDFVHVCDLAAAHYLGLRYMMEKECSECFNLGSGAGFTVLELIRALEELTGSPVPYRMGDRRSGDPAALVASHDKASWLLGWYPRHSEIHEILQDAVRWEENRKF